MQPCKWYFRISLINSICEECTLLLCGLKRERALENKMYCEMCESASAEAASTQGAHILISHPLFSQQTPASNFQECAFYCLWKKKHTKNKKKLRAFLNFAFKQLRLKKEWLIKGTPKPQNNISIQNLIYGIITSFSALLHFLDHWAILYCAV